MTEKAAPNAGEPARATAFALQKAADLGFARAGVTDTRAPARYEAYQEWLARGDHGSMAYMADDFHQRSRADMRELLPEVQSAIVVALSYDKPETAADNAQPSQAPRGRVAQYAVGDDYHFVIKDKLKLLGQALADELGRPVAFRACVDSAPLLERELAARAGLGFIAKNTMLISPGLGSYTLLGVLLIALEMEPTHQAQTRDCGTCTACLDACPTQAFRGPHKLDATRCISYLTIESREAIPEALREALGDRIFGCDECQDVCPYNAKAPLRFPSNPHLRARDPERPRPPLQEFVSMGSNPRKRYMRASAMQRNSREQLLRNVAVALGNAPVTGAAGEDAANESLQTLATDASPLVRDHAQWALAKRNA